MCMQKEQLGLCPDLVVSPAGLPHAQGLRVRELSLKAEQDPAMAEEQLEPVLPEPGQVLVEARQHESQQLPQVHLQKENLLSLKKVEVTNHSHFSHKSPIEEFLYESFF